MLRGRSVGLLAGLAAVAVAGCANDYTCYDYRDCAPEGGVDGKATADGRGDTSKPRPDGGADAKGDGRVGDGGSDGTVGEGGADAPGDVSTCNGTASPKDAPCVISETYGVFVAPAGNGGSDTTGTGSRGAPYATIGKGIASAGGKRVYVCGATYGEQVVVAAAQDTIGVFGGLACPVGVDGGGATDAATEAGAGGAWTYTGAKAVVSSPTPTLALSVSGLTTGAHFEDMGFVVKDTTNPGDSSYAVFANGAGATSFTRVAMTGGNVTVAGVGGVLGSNYSGTQASAGESPAAGSLSNGPASQTCTCGDATTSTGGRGGVGDTASPLGGGSGGPNLSGAAPNNGAGGTAGAPCAGAGTGSDGASASDAKGGTGATSAGTLASTGWTPGANGETGPNAGPAQGGGGGTGGLYTGSPATGGGGGGGCGGCGGGGGTGGGPGGSSFALLSVGSTLTLDACTLTAGSGGTGGIGGNGQAGESGGDPGAAAGKGCAGGAGGMGGGGGGGGGGAGGNSIAIGYTGTQPTTTNGTTTLFAATAALGGAPGSGGTPAATQGSVGLTLPTQSF